MAIEFNPFKVTEYRGFKVGDKVEVTERPSGRSIHGKDPKDLQYPFRGTIEKFEDGYGVNHERLVSAIIGGYGFIVDCLWSTMNIKKLPNYAVGDVVRSRNHNKVLEISEVAENHYRSTEGHYMTDAYIEPFDGFRVGDTVWSAKRGKGEIVAYNKSFDGSSTKRVFVVKFDNENSGLFDVSRRPKLSNLFPTERKMIESLPQKIAYAIPFPGTMPDFIAEMLGYKMVSTVGQASADPVRPKFKVDDVVCYNGSKWRIIGFRIEGYVLYTIKKDAITEFLVRESDLRLWKETKYRVCIAGIEGRDGYVVSEMLPYLSNVKHIGKSSMNEDIFIADLNTGKQIVLFGTKGDDIQ